MRTFIKPLPTNISSSIDTFASDLNKIVDVLAEIRASIPAAPADVDAVSVAQYNALANRVTALEAAMTRLETPVSSTVPTAPTITGIAVGDTIVTVSFNAPSNNGGSAITKYVATTSTGKSVEGTASPIVINGLTNGTALSVTVKAVNAVGTSPASAVSSTVIPVSVGKPSVPINFAATVGVGTVNLSWATPASDGGSAITGYRIIRNASVTNDVSATTRTSSITGLTGGTQYSFTIAAVNANGVGPAATLNATPVVVNNESKKVALLGIASGSVSKMPFNSGINPAGRNGRLGSPDGYEWVNDLVEVQRGVPFDIRTGYQYNNRSVTDTTNGWNDLIGMQVLDWLDPAFPAVLGMPAFPFDGTWAAMAAGTYDAKYKLIGQTIAAKRPAGTGKVVLRIAWEWNLDSALMANPAQFIAGWKKLVTAMRSGAGDRVQFSWSFSSNSSSLAQLQSMYPGDAYVDVIAIDTYDAFINVGQGYHTEADWLKWSGIDQVLTWAKSIGKLVALDEWGGHNNNNVQNHSGGDNPDWPNIVLEWCRKNADWIAYECSFCDRAPNNVLNNLWGYNGLPVDLPAQRAAYIAKVKSLVTS